MLHQDKLDIVDLFALVQYPGLVTMRAGLKHDAVCRLTE